MNIEKKHHIPSCPKTGRSIKPILKRFCSLLLFPVIGLVALIWFLVRVIPKPTRATYPCQRVAAPLASGFVLWAIGAIASVTAFRKAKQYFLRHRYLVAILCLLIGISLTPVILNGWHEKVAQADQYDYTYVDPVPNSPIGIARGIYPGRVIWFHNRDATDWNGPGYGHWWEDSHTDQEEVDDMVSLALRAVTSVASDTEAWDMLFKHFNGNDTGYLAGEKIMIKLNLVGTHYTKYNVNKTTGEQTSTLDYTNTSPQMMMALLKQLVYNAGVNPSDIMVGDPTANIPNQYWDLIIQEFGSGKVTGIDHHEYLGRTAAVKSTTAHIYWSGTARNEGVATCFEEATYVINFACLKAHTDAGITVCAKNHYGSLVRTPGPFWDWSGDTYLNLHPQLLILLSGEHLHCLKTFPFLAF